MATKTRTWRGWQRLATAIALAAFALALIGLHGERAAAGGTALASRASTVNIDHFAFTPATLTVAKGAKVTFANSSSVTHTATRDGSFDSGLIKAGKSVAIRFKQKGTFAYHCEIHPQMHGKIVVD
ncbi:MAG TPA: cupredoxin domain-containing protein [Solirubrobacterales bacterium]|jgi:plastocyanin|nr:cupredoxin domain-containing protein [Solirubrobacterales bacterium]